MAVKAIAKPLAGGSGESFTVYFYWDGHYFGKLELYKDVLDAAAAQDRTDFAVHVSSTVQGLTKYSLTTIS